MVPKNNSIQIFFKPTFLVCETFGDDFSFLIAVNGANLVEALY